MSKDAYFVASSDGLGLIITIVQLKENDEDNNYAEWAKDTPIGGQGAQIPAPAPAAAQFLLVDAAGGRGKPRRLLSGRAPDSFRTQQQIGRQQIGRRSGVDGWANTAV
ncbi:hypothetical protein M9H77_02494 [Catharanthus roseus]|uniref:Uncharacterized protein n=1 Tax=Catharanthus roseus TaxID=4058 RepID=A0ACC0C8V5_CATRO|nr:hypothetical protein M9H77_02494 [Catharanthus roseus]